MILHIREAIRAYGIPHHEFYFFHITFTNTFWFQPCHSPLIVNHLYLKKIIFKCIIKGLPVKVNRNHLERKQPFSAYKIQVYCFNSVWMVWFSIDFWLKFIQFHTILLRLLLLIDLKKKTLPFSFFIFYFKMCVCVCMRGKLVNNTISCSIVFNLVSRLIYRAIWRRRRKRRRRAWGRAAIVSIIERDKQCSRLSRLPLWVTSMVRRLLFNIVCSRIPNNKSLELLQLCSQNTT